MCSLRARRIYFFKNPKNYYTLAFKGFFMHSSPKLYMNYTSLPRVFIYFEKPFNYPYYIGLIKRNFGLNWYWHTLKNTSKFIFNFQVYFIDTKRGPIDNFIFLRTYL